MNATNAANLKIVLGGKKVLLGVSGSIAAFKACDIVRFLKDAGAEVQVVLTDSASEFVTPLTLETLSGKPVYSKVFGDGQGTHHIDLARWADAILIAPATANALAKIANGMADDLLSTETLAATCPIAVAPAMNPAMFANAATQANLKTLESRGIQVFGPTSGDTACGEVGPGRMLEAEEIVTALATSLCAQRTGLHAVVTMGATRSFLDPVRFLSNRSSGKMGASLVWALENLGIGVTAIVGKQSEEWALPAATRTITVDTAEEMLKATTTACADADFFISAAAVLDWQAKRSEQKIKKDGQSLSLELDAAPDVLRTICERRESYPRLRYVLGFAAETENWVENARKKLQSKGCDAVFCNNVGQASGLPSAFEAEKSAGIFVTSKESIELPTGSAPITKAELAEKIIEQVLTQKSQKLKARPDAALDLLQ